MSNTLGSFLAIIVGIGYFISTENSKPGVFQPEVQAMDLVKKSLKDP